MSLKTQSQKHLSLLEQNVNYYAPRLWARTLPMLLRWLKYTLAAIRPQVESLVFMRDLEAESAYLETVIHAVPDLDPNLLPSIADIANQVPMQYGFLPSDPRRKVITRYTRELLEDDLLSYWKTLTSPKTLSRRISKLRAQGLSYQELSQTLASQYKTSFASAERLVRTSYNSASNYAAWRSLIKAGEDGKRWLSSKDRKVRRRPRDQFDHKDADGQIVAIDQPFIVSGERLMFPGDRSLGASKGNLIHCRCSLIGADV